MCAAVCHHTEVWLGWRAAYCLQTTLTLAPSSSQHQDPMHVCLSTSVLSGGWSQHPQQLCPSLLQITVNSGTSVTSSLQTDRTKRCLLMQENICQVRKWMKVLSLSCILGTALGFAPLHGVSADLRHGLCLCFCLTIPLWILCHAHHAKATPVLENLQTRLSGFLGLTSSNGFAEG